MLSKTEYVLTKSEAQGELMWLTKADVDLENRLLRIRAKTFRKEVCAEPRRGRTGASGDWHLACNVFL